MVCLSHRSPHSKTGARSVDRRTVRPVLLHLLVGGLLTAALAGCRSEGLPRPGTEAYLDVVVSFYTGLAALQAGDDLRARDRLTDVTRRVPDEPAGWANLGLLDLRHQVLDSAALRLERAHDLAPSNGDILALLGHLESVRGRPDAALAYFRRAIEQDPEDLKTLYALAREAERLEAADGDAEAQRMLERILQIAPDNLAVRLDLIRLAARRGEIETVRDAVARLESRRAAWPEDARTPFNALREAAGGSDPAAVAAPLAFLRNVLVALPDVQQDLAAVVQPVGETGDPILRFLRLPAPRPTPSPLDEALAFTAEPLPDAGPRAWSLVDAVYLTGEGPPTLVLADGAEVRIGTSVSLPFPGGAHDHPPTPNGVLAVDLNHDYRRDLVLAGAGGLRLYLHDEDGGFTDASTGAGLEATVQEASYDGAWAADLEMDGDLDLIAGATEGAPRVLQNNGDGSFSSIEPFQGVVDLRSMAWADLNGDGAPDAALLDAAGRVHVYANERAGRFAPRTVPDTLGPVAAMAAADLEGNGRFGVIALRTDGSLARLTLAHDGLEPGPVLIEPLAGFSAEPLAESGTGQAVAPAGLLVADFDNNGGLDVLATLPSAARIGLSDTTRTLRSNGPELPARILAAADLTGNGRLDLVGLAADGRAVRFVNAGGLDYPSQVIRPRAAQTQGDGRINSFGIGGEIEVRSGLLFQKQPITGPVAHFGLGEHALAEIVRIVWPNGTVQAEFNLAPDHPVLTEQRLKGSCPFVFAWNGAEMAFVTDFLWRSPLGLAINAQETAGVAQTEDWIRIRGDQLAEKDGTYDIRITADLWETHFFDRIALKVVDHPEGTEVFVDERFVIPPPALAVHPTSPPRPFARARDDRGRDVTGIVREVDERYLDFFGRGAYQGVTRPHYVEIELGNAVPRTEGLVLIGHGWVRPTDSSINVAIGQGSHPPPQGLRLDVQDRTGAWKEVAADLGFPAGKRKTVLIDLDGAFEPGIPRRLRLHTNLEIYWDALQWAIVQPERAQPEPGLRIRDVVPERAELRYRGFNVMPEVAPSAPEVAEYRIGGTTQRWRDLIGFYTRFGDVRELVREADDRYVIANAGDELALLFAAPPPPPEGWTRTFVLMGVGWNKDGDYNTAYSETVRPLPSHHRPDYTSPPGRLSDDPVYRQHPDDWHRYHTRYVTPERFRTLLRPDS